MSVAPEKLEAARALRAKGVGWRTTARRVGVPMTSLRYALDPAYAEQSRASSYAAKRRRKGSCLDCGAPTSLSSASTPSDRCARCAPLHARVIDREEVLRLRLEEELTQTAIAKRVGCAQNTVSLILIQAGHRTQPPHVRLA